MPTEEQTNCPFNLIVRGFAQAGDRRVGQMLRVTDRTITHLSFKLAKFTQLGQTTTAPVYYEIRHRSDWSLIYSQLAVAWASLPDDLTFIEIELATPPPIEDEIVWIGIFHQSGFTNAGCRIAYSKVDVKANEELAKQDGAGAWGYGWITFKDCGYSYTWQPSTVAPTASTNPATSVEANSSTPNGTLDDDGGEACDCGFEWGETIAYGNTTPIQSRTTGQTFAQTISGLDPKKTYHFRAFATNAAGTGYGADRTFTTLAAAPTADTDPATDIEHIAAALNGELTYDGGEACNCGFEYGETDAYGTTTPTQSKVTGEAFSQPITGLDPNKTYHFRAIATNSAETGHGADRTFQTLASAPTVTTDAATGRGAISATINGTLDNDIGEACQCGFEWGLDTNYGTITPTESKTTGETFSQVIGGLVPNTVYHFRAFATNSFGTGYGTDRTFTTALVISRAYALARREL